MMEFKSFKKNGKGYVALFVSDGKVKDYGREDLRKMRSLQQQRGKPGEPCAELIKFVLERWPDTALAKRIKTKRIKKQ